MHIKINKIPAGFGTVYAISGEQTILVDSGSPGKISSIVFGLEKSKINPHDVRLIILTHSHWDHMGCAARLKDLTGAKLAVHEAEAERVRNGKKFMPPAIGVWGSVVKFYCDTILLPRLTLEPASIDLVINDQGLSLEPYGIDGRVLHTPGHSPGSVSIVLNSGEAFVGDLAMNIFPLRRDPVWPILAEQPELVKDSIKKILNAGAKRIYPAHGAAFSAKRLEGKLKGTDPFVVPKSK